MTYRISRNLCFETFAKARGIMTYIYKRICFQLNVLLLPSYILEKHLNTSADAHMFLQLMSSFKIT